MYRSLLIVLLCFSLSCCGGFAFDSPDTDLSSFFSFLTGKKPYKRISDRTKASKILVLKEDRWLKLLDENGETIKSYKIALGKEPVGRKRFEGDNKTPEGLYYINNKNPYSRYYLSLQVSYPNAADRAYAARFGKSAGGEIMIHGIENGTGIKGYLKHIMNDKWTAGCIAVKNKQMDEIWKLVDVGTPIEIRP